MEKESPLGILGRSLMAVSGLVRLARCQPVAFFGLTLTPPNAVTQLRCFSRSSTDRYRPFSGRPIASSSCTAF
jgi:hypothetical protein